MKAKWILAVGLGLLAIPAGAQDPTAPTTPKDKVSYGIGVQVAKTLKSQGIDVNTDLVIKGLRDVLSGQKLLMSDEDLNTTMGALQQEVAKKQMQERAKLADDNKKAGESFLADNSKKEGIVALPSGLQYKVVKAADGKKNQRMPTPSPVIIGALLSMELNSTNPKPASQQRFRSGRSSLALKKVSNLCRSGPDGSSSFLPIWPMVTAARATRLGPTPRSFLRSNCFLSKTKPRIPDSRGLRRLTTPDSVREDFCLPPFHFIRCRTCLRDRVWARRRTT